MAITIGAKMDNAVKKPCQGFGAACKSSRQKEGKGSYKVAETADGGRREKSPTVLKIKLDYFDFLAIMENRNRRIIGAEIKGRQC